MPLKVSQKVRYDVGDLVAMRIDNNSKPRYSSGIVVRSDENFVFVKMNFQSIERKFQHKDLYFFLNELNKK